MTSMFFGARVLAFALLAGAGPAAAESWLSAGRESGERVAIDIERSMAPGPDGVLAVVLTVPPQRRGRTTYTVWFNRYDCTARTRTRGTSIVSSSWRDPVRREITSPVVETAHGDDAIARQLAVICGGPGERTTGARYDTLRAFVEAGG